jgi:hypothetical protein
MSQINHHYEEFGTGAIVDEFNAQIVVTGDQPGAGGANTRYTIQIPAALGGPLSEGTTHVIQFQDGPLAEGVNGLTNEVLFAILKDRMLGFQSGPYACGQNMGILDRVTSGLNICHQRTKRRQWEVSMAEKAAAQAAAQVIEQAVVVPAEVGPGGARKNAKKAKS